MGEHSAYTRRYCVPSSKSSPSAPMAESRGEDKPKSIAPSTAPEAAIPMHAQVNTLFALSYSFLPNEWDIITEEPTPIRSATAKFMITNGMARLTAANAVSPKNCPTIIPSIN